MLNLKISNLNLNNPIILASGILGVSYYSMKRVIEAGAGAVTTKSIGPKPRKGYKNPSVIELYPGTFLNSVGLANPGVDEFCKEIKKLKKIEFPLIASIFGNTEETFSKIALKMEEIGFAAVELNISCPHAEVSSIGISSELTHSLVKRISREISIPLFVKLNPNVTDITEIALAAEQGGANAVVAINAVEAMSIDTNIRRPILSHGSGGLSGKAIHPIAVKKVYDLYKVLKIPIIGCGGVFDYKDAIEFFLAGASAIQIGTALYQNLEIIAEIKRNLENYLKDNDFHSILDIKGLAHEYQMQEVPDY